ncbi:MAG: chromate transporter [Lentisphaeria bacterium]
MSEQQQRIWTLFHVFFYVSAVALGGSLAMLPLVKQEFVDKRHWLSNDDMVDTVAVMQSLPGILSINMAALIGYRVAGITGAGAAAIGVALPPFLSIIIIAAAVQGLLESPIMGRIFHGVRSAVCALILLAAIKLAKQILTSRFAVILAAFAFVVIVFLPINAIWVVALSALAGYLYQTISRLRKQQAPRSES